MIFEVVGVVLVINGQESCIAVAAVGGAEIVAFVVVVVAAVVVVVVPRAPAD